MHSGFRQQNLLSLNLLSLSFFFSEVHLTVTTFLCFQTITSRYHIPGYSSLWYRNPAGQYNLPLNVGIVGSCLVCDMSKIFVRDTADELALGQYVFWIWIHIYTQNFAMIRQLGNEMKPFSNKCLWSVSCHFTEAQKWC